MQELESAYREEPRRQRTPLWIRHVSGSLFNWLYPARSRQGERAGIETFTDRDKLQVPCESTLVMNVP